MSCWPTTADIESLARVMSPKAARNIPYVGGQPLHMSVPIGSPYDQPLYFHNYNMSAIYTRNMTAYANETCWDFSTSPTSLPEICFQAIRNMPVEGKPAFVVWPRNKREVMQAVRFAISHYLCIAVAGTGHDFLNRHSCTSAPFFLIRMTFLKGATFNFSDLRGSPDGSVTFGAGNVFSEAHAITSDQGYYIASGWATTVGVVGWALGGGHGPFGSSAGAGAMNIIEAEVVTAQGIWVKVNNESNPDLWWALRGGGGSTWGIVVSITVPLRKNPPGGFTIATLNLADAVASTGPDGSSTLSLTLGAYLKWRSNLSSTFSGLAFFSASPSDQISPVPYWTSVMIYVCLGSEEEVMPGLSPLLASLPKLYSIDTNITNVANFYQYVATKPLETIYPFPVIPPSSPSFPAGDATDYVGGVTSVLVNSSVIASGQLQKVVLAKLADCVNGKDRCIRQEFYDDIPGHYDSPPWVNVSLSAGMQTASLHFVFAGYNQSTLESSYYRLGSNSYFSESSYFLPDWKERYWGSNYDRLLAIKKKYDPRNHFGCRHCVGDETP